MSTCNTEKNGGNTLKIEFLELKNALIYRHKILIFTFGVILILSGLWICEASRPVYEDREEVVSSYTNHGSYTYTAPVTRANPLYPIGTTLKMGMPAYFFVVSPIVNISFTYSLEAADTSDLNCKMETMIIASGKEESMIEGSDKNNREKIFWKKEFPLKAEEGAETWNGPSVTKNFSLNVPEIQSTVKSVADQLNYSQDATIEIVNRVNYVGKINGEEVQDTKDFAIPLVIKSSYYQMPEKLDFSQDTNITKKISARSETSLLSIRMPLFLCLFSLFIVGTTLICVRTKKVEPEYIEKLKKEQRLSPFKEFVSRGKLPKGSNSLMEIEISSLKELVDVAVDMNSRVIYDAESEIYFMINNDALYVFFDTSEEKSNRE